MIKKRLSYREHKLLGRALIADEAREVINIARRIAAILLLFLDANYQAIKTKMKAQAVVGSIRSYFRLIT